MPAGDAGFGRQTLSEQVRKRLAVAHLQIDDVLPHRDAAPFHEILDNAQQLTDQIGRLQAQLAAQQAVVDAARELGGLIDGYRWSSHSHDRAVRETNEQMRLALRALDKAQAAQPEGEQA